jgi:hypothetical protein
MISSCKSLSKWAYRYADHLLQNISKSLRRIMRRFRLESFGPTCLDFNSPVEINSYSIVRLRPEYADASLMLSSNFVGCPSSRIRAPIKKPKILNNRTRRLVGAHGESTVLAYGPKLFFLNCLADS